MKPKLHTLLILATSISANAVIAQENPPPAPQRPDAPQRPSGPPRGEDEPRRPEGDRAPGAEGRRGPVPAEGARRGGQVRGESVFRSPMQPQPPQRLRPYLGVVTSPAPAAVAAQAGLPEGFGLVVDEVLPESPAKTGGVERYDVLTRFDDQKLVDPAQLAALVGATAKDAEVSLTLLRRGQERKVTVKVGEKLLPGVRTTLTRPALPDLRDAWRRFGEAAGPITERAEDAGRRAQEIGREFQRRMQEFQEKVEQWRKNPNEKFPEAPKFPNLAPPPSRPSGPLPGDILREVRPGGAPSVQISGPSTTTIWGTADANVSIKDDAGEIEVRSENGRRTVIAKDKSGAVLFNGPIDTEEQRRQLPEGVRRKLDNVETRTRIEHREPPRETPPQPGGDVQ
jgi:hypothetical protein